MYIACPCCDWRPAGYELWACTCRHTWHTFATHGVCPACGKAWEYTCCHQCKQWSKHEDWYHDDDDPTWEEYLAEPQRVLKPIIIPLTVPSAEPVPEPLVIR